MHPSPHNSTNLALLGETLLRAFDLIEQFVSLQLRERQMAGDPLLRGEAQARLQNILDSNRSALQTLRREPAIARVEIEWLDNGKVEYLYVCRASSAGARPEELDGKLVTYRAPLGRLAEICDEDRLCLLRA